MVRAATGIPLARDRAVMSQADFRKREGSEARLSGRGAAVAVETGAGERRRRPPRPDGSAQDAAESLALETALAPLARVLSRGLGLPSALIVVQAQDRARIVVSAGPLPTGDGPDVIGGLTGLLRRRSDNVLVFPDLAADPAPAGLRLRLGGQPVRFLALIRLTGPDGAARGALCVCDAKPRRIAARQMALLADIRDSAAQALGLCDTIETYQETVAHGPHMVWTTDAGGEIIEAADRLRALFGPHHPGRLQDALRDLVHPDDAETLHQRWTQALGSGTTLDVEFRLRVEGDAFHWFHAHATPRRNGSGAITRWCGLIEDVHARRLDHIRVAHLAYYDVLTGLGNRAHFTMMLEQHLAAVGRGRHFALLRLELYDFRAMSDTLGHEFGDRLLAQVATRIGACIRQTDLLAHEGGDAFFIILADVALPEEAVRLAERILRTLSAPVALDAASVSMSAAIGLTMCPADGAVADVLLQNVDLALTRARQAGRGRCCLFSLEMDERLRLRQALKADMSDALDRQQFSLAYQPVVDARSGKVRALEALLRWNHPVRGLVSPLDFIPQAESNGMIVPIGQWVIEQACRDAASLPAELVMAVNLSSVQIRHPGLVQTVADTLRATGLPPRRLMLEITESVPLLDDVGNLAVLNALRALGVQIALDDFGTGYASLSYLQCFSFDMIKIERSFTARIQEGDEARTILRAVIRLSQALGISCVAEGVETSGQHDFLRVEGCDGLQGFYFSRPIALPQLAETLDALAGRRVSERWAPRYRELV